MVKGFHYIFIVCGDTLAHFINDVVMCDKNNNIIAHSLKYISIVKVYHTMTFLLCLRTYMYVCVTYGQPQRADLTQNCNTQTETESTACTAHIYMYVCIYLT